MVNTSQQAAAQKLLEKGRKALESRASRLGALTVEYLAINAVRPNSYNPNRQSKDDFELLSRSIDEDGFNQPIVVRKETMEIVDGEHRWRCAREKGFTQIPCVLVSMTDQQMRVSTLRHNRARGSEDL